MKEIESLWAFLANDTPEDEEGIIVTILPGIGTLPMLAGKESIANQLKDRAQDVANARNTTVRLVRFTRVEVLEVFYPLGGKTQ